MGPEDQHPWENEEISQAFAAKDAEILRLKEENAHFAWRDKDKNKLINELFDALEEDEDFIAHQFEFSKEKIRDKFRPLIARARRAMGEVTR